MISSSHFFEKSFFNDHNASADLTLLPSLKDTISPWAASPASKRSKPRDKHNHSPHSNLKQFHSKLLERIENAEEHSPNNNKSMQLHLPSINRGSLMWPAEANRLPTLSINDYKQIKQNLQHSNMYQNAMNKNILHLSRKPSQTHPQLLQEMFVKKRQIRGFVEVYNLAEQANPHRVKKSKLGIPRLKCLSKINYIDMSELPALEDYHKDSQSLNMASGHFLIPSKKRYLADLSPVKYATISHHAK